MDTQPEVRRLDLVRFSLTMAIFLEVLPVEATLFALATVEQLGPLCVVKLLCLALILGPLALFIRINGWNALRYVRGRVITIGVIIVLHLVMNVMMVYEILQRDLP